MSDPIPLFDVQAQYARLREDIDARLRAVLDHGRYVLGPEVSALEAALSELAGGRHVVSCGNGTDALILALMAEGIGPGDAVFVPSFTFVATAGAVVAVGATPVFVDVDSASFNMNAADLEARVATVPDGLRPRAVMPVDLFGQPADYDAIGAVAAAHGLAVIADAAQSLGGGRNGVPVGALAPVSATSFYPTKPLGALGDGGAVFTDDADRAARLRSIRVHGGETRDGVNSRLDTMQAAILLAKLQSFTADRDRRASVAARYDAAFAGHLGLQVCAPGVSSAHAVYGILSPQRDALAETLKAAGIASRAYYATPIHLMASMAARSAGPGSLPVTETLTSQILALPLYADISDAQADRVIEAVLGAGADGLSTAAQ